MLAILYVEQLPDTELGRNGSTYYSIVHCKRIGWIEIAILQIHY